MTRETVMNGNRGRNILVRVCGVILIVCAALTLSSYNAWAFNSDHMMMVMVPFSRIISWITTSWFSLDSLVGLCYLLALIFSVLLIILGAFFVAGAKVGMDKKAVAGIVKITLLVLCVFYLFATVINVISGIARGYAFIEFIVLVALSTAYGVISRKTKITESR